MAQSKTKVAQAIAAVSLTMAKKACGAASMYGLYQPKEPAKVASLKK